MFGYSGSAFILAIIRANFIIQLFSKKLCPLRLNQFQRRPTLHHPCSTVNYKRLRVGATPPVGHLTFKPGVLDSSLNWLGPGLTKYSFRCVGLGFQRVYRLVIVCRMWKSGFPHIKVDQLTVLDLAKICKLLLHLQLSPSF